MKKTSNSLFNNIVKIALRKSYKHVIQTVSIRTGFQALG